jgi:dipeptidyl aminopeptidase/acylaminoacyl peptidase
VAYWVDRGWAVLLVNYRGSTGYGRAYAQALREQWGLHDVTDTVSGARAMADRGWVDGRRMVVQGGSAGGYTVLLCLARHADVFAAGVDLFGVADLFKLAEETHRFESRYLDSLIGPLPATYTRYVERSPVTVADQIRAPLLVLQGNADEVVPPNQSQAIVDAVRAKGCAAELHLYPGEGHGWKKVENIADELTRVEKFLRRHVLRLAGE